MPDADVQRFIPVKADPPWGRPCYVEIPEEFWSNDWLRGVRAKTYLGEICSHYEGGVCLQPPNPSQCVVSCIPIPDIDAVEITVLEGKLSDYA